jgi:protein-S-isoprenylcysteine O-methyltransferase Ste14
VTTRAKSRTAPAQRPGLLLRIPPPVWLLLSLIVAWVVHHFIATPVIVRSLPAAVVLIVAGIAVAMWGGATFSDAGTELHPTSETNAKLVTNGPFRYTRNPMYSGVMLVSLGVALILGTVPFFVMSVLLFLLVNSIFIPYEEAKMERQYGAQFRAYKTRVRRWGIL